MNKLVIFDMDGTILDTIDDLRDSVNHILNKYGYKEISILEAKSYIGNGLRVLLEKAISKEIDNGLFNKMFIELVEEYKKNSTNKTKPYPKIKDVIVSLKKQGYKLAVISNKIDSEVKKLSIKYFDDLFDLIIGETPLVKRKPDPSGINYAIKYLNSSIDDTVYIGDTEVDYLCAENAFIKTVLVSWGFREKLLLKKYNVTIADEPKELIELIKELIG